jgi:uncharacterized protein YybS (DUF2232 family)
MERNTITEVIIMAAFTALMATAGYFIPILEPVLIMGWALPVVVVCMRKGMQAGAATIAAAAVATIVAVSVVTIALTGIGNSFDAILMYAVGMMLRTAAPALLLGYGFLRGWKSEKTLFVTTIATFIGFVVAVALSVSLMGISYEELFMLQPEMAEEIAAMLTEYMSVGGQGLSPEVIRQITLDSYAMMQYLLPSIILVFSMLSSLIKFIAANFVLGKLKIQLPAITRVDAFRLPFSAVFAFILGYGLDVATEAFWLGADVLMIIGQNLMLVSLAVYFFQGMGLILYLIRKTPRSTRVFWRILLFLTIVWTNVFFLQGVGYIGVADALFDFRRVGTWFKEEIEKRRRDT